VTEVALPPPVFEKAAQPPPARTRMLHALSSDWGLRILALVLSVLLWSVVRQDISVEQRIFVDVVPIPDSPDSFEAYLVVRDRVEITLRGPQRELDEAKELLGVPPRIEVRVRDLEPGKDYEVISESWSDANRRIVVGTARRLIHAMPTVFVRVYRRLEQRARIAPLVWDNLPDGYFPRDVRLDPGPEVELMAPAGALGQDLVADSIDVGPDFADGSARKGPLTKQLHFNQWRKSPGDPDKAVVREKIQLPKVTATVSFKAVKTEDIENALQWSYSGLDGDGLGDYAWVIDGSVPDLNADQMRFKGTFRGGDADLEALQGRLGEWQYVLRIPLDEMRELKNGTDTVRKFRAVLDWAPTSDTLRALHASVEFIPPPSYAEVPVTVTKKQ
jgi:hypothetical protein